MSLYYAWFGTVAEQKREQYKELYTDLSYRLEQFQHKVKQLEYKVNRYASVRPIMSSHVIPEDVFSMSEANVYRKVEELKVRQAEQVSKLSRAVDAAYERYKYYEYLAFQEQLEREKQSQKQQ